jgi:hypothetical protein
MLDEQLPETKSTTHNLVRFDGRLPGRRLSLLPELLRLPQRHNDAASRRSIGDQSELTPFTGVMVAVVLSVPIWIAISGLVYYLI